MLQWSGEGEVTQSSRGGRSKEVAVRGRGGCEEVDKVAGWQADGAEWAGMW